MVITELASEGDHMKREYWLGATDLYEVGTLIYIIKAGVSVSVCHYSNVRLTTPPVLMLWGTQPPIYLHWDFRNF